MKNSLTNTVHHFLEGGGEMGRLTRELDWSATPVGDPETWPQSLRTIISIILTSKFPMFLWWGPELICFYNDAYRPSLGKEGKHPSILGMPAKAAWPEIWVTIAPLIEQVLAGGEATWSEDQLIPIYRNGRMEDVYWTFSYSPAKDESGKAAGVLVTCTETTGKVNALQKLNLAQENINNIISQAPVAIAIFRGPEFVIELANEKVLEYWGRTYEQVINVPLFSALPEASGQGFEELLTGVMQTGVPFIARELPVTLMRNGILETTWIDFLYDPLRELNGEITGIIVVCSEVTEQVNSRVELEKTAVTLKQAIDSANIGTWTADLETDSLFISQRTRLIHGIPEGKNLTLTESLEIIVAEHRQRVADEIQDALTQNKSFTAEYIIAPMDGSTRKWLRATGKPVYEKGVPRNISGTMMDITEQKQDDQRKSDFIGMVSHELKTPLTTLTAIVQVTEAKLKNNPDTFLSGAMEKATVQVKKMSKMINGFLNISRLESGKMIVEKTSFEMNELIKETIKENELASSTHIIQQGVCDVVKISADRDKLGSVISNLINNAIKYSPKGKYITINCQVVENRLIFSVQDEGMGIKEADIPNVFDRYFRVETNHTKHISGFGIGLYLSAEIVKHHDGEIWVESKSGIGSTFFFSLPLDNSSQK